MDKIVIFLLLANGLYSLVTLVGIYSAIGLSVANNLKLRKLTIDDHYDNLSSRCDSC